MAGLVIGYKNLWHGQDIVLSYGLLESLLSYEGMWARPGLRAHWVLFPYSLPAVFGTPRMSMEGFRCGVETAFSSIDIH